MIKIFTNTPGEAWIKSCQKIARTGSLTWDNKQKLKELLNVFIIIQNPYKKDKIIKQLGDTDMIKWMLNNFLKKVPVLNWGYSYGSRFFSFGNEKVNQVQDIIKKLTLNPDSKSATISLMNPAEDTAHVPCIVAIDFKLRNRTLTATAFFRSQDAGKKLYADILALGEIMKIIASKTNSKPGPLNILISSLHFYLKDWEFIKKIIRKGGKGLCREYT